MTRLFRNSKHVASLEAVIMEQAEDDDVQTVHGYVLPRYDYQLRNLIKAKRGNRRGGTSALFEISFGQRFKIIRQLSECVYTLHKHGIAHLDLSGTNIMVNIRDGRVETKVIDFGSCCFFQDDAARRRSDSVDDFPPVLLDFDSDVGHVTYRSPEAFFRGHKIMDPTKIDIWALGVMIYETLVGHLAWDSKFGDEVRLTVQSSTKVAAYTKDLPPTWQVLLACCLRPNPQDRWVASRIFRFVCTYETPLMRELEELYV